MIVLQKYQIESSCADALRELYRNISVDQGIRILETDWNDKSHPSTIISLMYPKGTKRHSKVRRKQDGQYEITKLKEIPSK